MVEDDASFRRALVEVIGARPEYDVLSAASGGQALECLQESAVDAVVTDLVMPGMRGEALLAEIRSAFPEIPVIAITAFGSIEAAVDLTRAGAADYLAKPFRTQALFDALERVLERTRPRREQARARARLGEHLDVLVGASRPMLRLFHRMSRVALSPAPILITGESGTGKELVARAVHQASGRGAFVPVNCGALPENLLESELFGHGKGAFTGADREKPGLFEAADGGTLFLDELGELPLPLQPKLLRAIEAGEIRRVGEVEPRQVSVRIIAATHRSLQAAAEAGDFREDLLWRLNVLRLEVPPLRERPADIPLLVEELLARISERDGTGEPPTIEPAVLSVLVAFPWPGNVRQLLNVLERAVAFAEGPEIGLHDLPAEIRRAGGTAVLVRTAADREATLAEVEREYILEVLRRAGGNKTRAAKLLGIPRRTLYRRLEEYEAPPEP